MESQTQNHNHGMLPAPACLLQPLPNQHRPTMKQGPLSILSQFPGTSCPMTMLRDETNVGQIQYFFQS